MEEQIKKTTKELQEVARHNGFYLCPVRVWNEVASVIEYKDNEIKRVKKERANWKVKYMELKASVATEITSKSLPRTNEKSEMSRVKGCGVLLLRDNGRNVMCGS